MEYILTIATILATILYYKYVIVPDQQIKRDLKKAAAPKDINSIDAQDDDFCLIAASIGKCKSEKQMLSCLKAIKTFKYKYGDSKTGSIDVRQLVEFLDAHQEKVCITM